MNPDEVPVPLEKSVQIVNGVVEVTIAEKKMTDKEKKVYKKFMAKCISGATGKSKKDAMLACAVDFEKMKDGLMKAAEEEEDDEEEDEDEDEMEEMKKEAEEEEEEEEEEYESAETLKEKIKIEEQDVKDDQEELKKLRKQLKEKSDSASKGQKKMEYREKAKTPANTVGIITVDQINKWERAEKHETRQEELKESKTVWKNTIDL